LLLLTTAIGNIKLGEMNMYRKQQFSEKISKSKLKGSLVDADETPRYRHPYETEILQMTYPESAYTDTEPTQYQPVDTTSATWVDTYEGVLEMLEELKKAKEIAVDLEHHDYRTYSGLVSLMQISTRERDWIVDPLKPWRHRLEVLNEVFADPSIIKVNEQTEICVATLTPSARCSTAPTWTYNGCREILAYT
jgi:exosome complex exonuclease RRP6